MRSQKYEADLIRKMREMEAMQAQSEGWKSKYDDAQSQLMERIAELEAAKEQVSSPAKDLGPDLQLAQATNARLTDELASAREQMERLVATHTTEVGDLQHELAQLRGLRQTTIDLRARIRELEERMKTTFISPDARDRRASRTGGASQLGRFSASFTDSSHGPVR